MPDLNVFHRSSTDEWLAVLIIDSDSWFYVTILPIRFRKDVKSSWF